MQITANATNFRRSGHFGDERTAIERGAFDLDVALTIEDVTLHGEVTIVLRDQEWLVYGDALDHWISGALLQTMRATLTADQMREATLALASAAFEAAS